MNRRALSSLALALTALYSGCRANAAPSNELERIDPALARVQREIWEVWFAGDTTRLKEIVGDDLVAMAPGTQGFSSVRDEVNSSSGFHAGGGKLIDLKFPTMRVQQFGDVVLVYTSYEYAFVMGKDTTRQAGRATEVFVKRNGKWLNPAWHMDSAK